MFHKLNILFSFLRNLSIYDRIFVISSLLFVIPYYIFRPIELILVIFAQYFIFNICLRLGHVFTIKKIYAVPSLLALLFYSYFNSRLVSADGLNYHLKFILAIVEKGYVATTEYPIKPYLGELILAQVYKFFGLHGFSLFLGFIAVINILCISILLKKLIRLLPDFIDKNLTYYLSLYLVVLSPTFLAFASQELKVDLISSLFMFLSMILVLNMMSVPDFTKKGLLLLLLAFLTGISVIVKTSTLITSLGLFISGSLLLLKNFRDNFFKKFIFCLVACFLYISPVLMWGIYYGGTFPQFENLINIKGVLKSEAPLIFLARDPTILSQCNSAKLKKDYSSYVYGSRSILVLLQPLFYITRFRSTSVTLQTMATPGIFLYMGMILLLIVPLIPNFRFIINCFRYIYIVALISYGVFLIFVSSIFWYLFYIFPIFSICIAISITSIENKLLKKVTVLFVIGTLVANLFYVTIFNMMLFDPTPNLKSISLLNSPNKNLFLLNSAYENLPKDGYILDASEHPDLLLTPFFHGGDLRIVKSNYYFASTKNNIDRMREEFITKGIKYIIVDRKQLAGSWYEGCPKRNNELLEQFLVKYTNSLYPKGAWLNNYIFEIVH